MTYMYMYVHIGVMVTICYMFIDDLLPVVLFRDSKSHILNFRDSFLAPLCHLAAELFKRRLAGPSSSAVSVSILRGEGIISETRQ